MSDPPLDDARRSLEKALEGVDAPRRTRPRRPAPPPAAAFWAGLSSDERFAWVLGMGGRS